MQKCFSRRARRVFAIFSRYGLLLLLAIPTASCGGPFSALTTLVGIPLAGATAKDIISAFEDSASRLLQQGESTGDHLLFRAGVETRVATRNVSYALEGQQDKLWKNLSVQQQALLVQLDNHVSDLEKSAGHLATMVELTSIDLQALVGRALPWARLDFYVSSIAGVTVVKTEQAHELTVRGLGFGTDNSKFTYQPKMAIDGVELPTTSYQRTQARELSVRIPPEFLAKHFATDETRLVSVNFTTQITKVRTGRTKEYGLDFELILMPLNAGTIVVVEPIVETRLGESRIQRRSSSTRIYVYYKETV